MTEKGDYENISVKRVTKRRLEGEFRGKETWDEMINRILDELHEGIVEQRRVMA